MFSRLRSWRPWRRERRRSDYILQRREFLERFVDLSNTRGLEIGSLDFPLVAPSQGCAYADIRTEADLAARFGIPHAQIAPIDYVLYPERPFHSQIRARFDYVVLCHVLEHVVNPIAYLRDMVELLEPGGVLFLAVPDKRRTSDASRPSTSVDALIERHLDDARRPSLALVAEFAREWSPERRELADRSPRDFYRWVREHQLYGDLDVHCNVWEDRELFEQLRYLVRAGYLRGVEVAGEQLNRPPWNEFYVALRRLSSVDHPEREVLPARAGVYFRTCNFCGGGRFRIFKRVHSPFPERIYGTTATGAREQRRQLNLQYLECAKCGLVCASPLPRFFDVNVRRFDPGHELEERGEEAVSRLEKERTEVMSVLYEQHELEGYRHSNRILDASCGPGIALHWLRKEGGWEVMGVDPAAHFVRFAQRRYGLTVKHGLAQDLTEPDDFFDVAIVDSALHYFFDPMGVLLTLYRLLRPGGAVVISVPNKDGYGTRYLDRNAQWGHWFLFSPKVLYRALREIGFHVQRVVGIQTALDPRLQERGIDLDRQKGDLRVRLQRCEEVDEHISSLELRADYFSLSAVKPLEARGESHDEQRLRWIAQDSIRPRGCVAIEPGEPLVWREPGAP